ncbi:MAG TPA: DUF2330 domain-containing protein [Egicoccus sp.]|nr:DUF2330 domain-containing protein [Egicoccus sp.]HSK22635.1 DUF2330 domain-containing protein [Egicoccus sp.]
MRRIRRWALSTTTMTVAALALTAGPALACGGLVGANGTIELGRTTTLAAYTDGVQRYVTAFEFSGEGEEVGSIIPLPDVPTDVTRAGDWTLQRLVLEVDPPEVVAFEATAEAGAADADVEVLLETEVDALDLTVLRGGADEVGRWAVDNGFFLTPDAPEVLDFYAERSEIFLAAKFDASRAADLLQGSGDSTPIMLTIPTDQPWVPLRILSLGLDDSTVVEADVFLLTDDKPQLLAGGNGLALERSAWAPDGLLDDLRSDIGMAWLPQRMWLTYLPLSVPADELTYDLAISTDPGAHPSLDDVGIELASAAVTPQAPLTLRDWWPAAVALGVGAVVWLLAGAIRRLPEGPA